jgi:MoaA/NifB/PqqE/SkfB family radical SAM enzyme
VQKINLGLLRQTAGAARQLGLDSVSFFPVDLHRQAFNRPAGWEKDQLPALMPDVSDLECLEAELAALERQHPRDFACGFIQESPEKLRQRVLEYFEASLGLREFPPVRCNAPWISAVIEADGAVRPCFFHSAMGNIRQDRLGQILNSDQSVSFRRRLNPRHDATCRSCICTLYRPAKNNPG